MHRCVYTQLHIYVCLKCMYAYMLLGGCRYSTIIQECEEVYDWLACADYACIADNSIA